MVKFSIVIPAYNEEKGIKAVLYGLAALQSHGDHLEIIVVNDGSTDETEAEVKKVPSVKLINHKQNKGYGAALKTGMRQAQGEYIILCDSDGQHRLEDIEKIMKLSTDYDMVVGTRGKESHVQKNRVAGKKIISIVANYLSGEKIPDINSGLRSFKKEVIRKYLHLLPDSFSASTTSTMILLKKKHDILWEPITTVERVGSSTVKQLKHGFYTLFLILRVITLFHPLKVFFPVSFLLGIVGVIWGIIYLPTGGFSVFAGSLITASIVIFMFGILCDQVSQLRLEKYE